MIDIHCHLLPGIDDGAQDLSVSIEMAKLAVADGITTVVCTPHILPTIYDNNGPDIRRAVESLQKTIAGLGIPLNLLAGADVHLTPDLLEGIRGGRVLTLNDSRYLLLEPPHHTMPPRFEESVFALMANGYIPILTHPERLAWVDQHYGVIQGLARSGMIMQITAGSLTGHFGKGANHRANRMMKDNLIHVLATDAHDLSRRVPRLSSARDMVATELGEEEACKMVDVRPQLILENADPSLLALPAPRTEPERTSRWRFPVGIGRGKKC